MTISQFIEKHYRHFNARELLDASRAWKKHLNDGGKMFVTLAGAMSSAELGISLAEMIRQDKVHAISCTAANLEEDLFNLTAHNDYEMCPHYRDLSPDAEIRLRDRGFNRVTDTCIPETVMRYLEKGLMDVWKKADQEGASYMPSEFFYQLIRARFFDSIAQVPIKDSWVIAACEKNLPIYSPGFEDSTLGNILTADIIQKKISRHSIVKSGTEQMEHLVSWYRETSANHKIGFFQIGGGIAGDFAICCVPLLIQDLKQDVPYWSYFCQISDSTTSYGSYSGAVPNEKITWHKLDVTTPRFMINSDATIVAPLMFAYVLGE